MLGPEVRALFYLERPHRLTGAQRQLLLFLRHARELGLVAHGVAPAEGLCVDGFRAAGVPVTVVPAPDNLLLFGKKLLHIGAADKLAIFLRDVVPHARAVAELARRERAQMIHFNGPRGILAAGIAARMAELPAILHMRVCFPFEGIYRIVSQAFADRIILNAEALIEEIEPQYRHRCVAVHDGVEGPQRWSRPAARGALADRLGLGHAGGQRFVLSLSSPVPFKGLHHLLSAAGRIARLPAGLEVHFLLAGSSEDERYQTYLLDRVQREGLKNVHILGYFQDPEMLVVASDLLVLPTVDRERFRYPDGEEVDVRSGEGLPQAILEALAAGVPVVSSRIAGTPEEVTDGVTGYLIAQGDVDAMVERLGRLLADEPLRARMGEAARQDAAQRFDAPTQAARTLDVLRSVA